jgi:hypothetical protein
VSFYSPGVYHLSKNERKALKSTLTNYKAAPCRMLGFDPLSPKNFVVLDVVKGRVYTRGSCKFESIFNKKSIADFEEQLRISEVDEDFLEIDRDEFNVVGESIEETERSCYKLTVYNLKKST